VSIPLKPVVRVEWLLVVALAGLALLARLVGLHQRTGDMVIFETWSHQLVTAGGWRGLSKQIGNYNAPFLYLLLFATYLPGSLIVKIKLVWMVFDVVLAFFTYKLVGLAWPGRRIPVIAALIMVFVPTVILNASYYGQIDDMYASFCVGGLYFLLRGRPWWGLAMCGVALSLKPQGVFIFPLVGLLLLAGRIPWRSLLAVPAVYLALDVPALLLGRDPGELLTIYSPSRQSQWITRLTYQAPSIYNFIPGSPDRIDSIKKLGEIFLVALILGIYYVLIVRRVELTRARIVTVSALFAIMVPFLLAGMHERYFFLADVMAVALVFFRPRLWYVALLVESASFLSYLPYLFHWTKATLPMTVPSTLMFAALIVVAYHVVRDAAQPAADPPGSGKARVPAARAAADDPVTEVLANA
jgi:Gpi18-like mannosyltransferase